MSWVFPLLLTLQWLAISMAKTSEISLKDTPTACEDNWVFKDGFCYFFSETDDIVNPKDASQQCLVYYAEHVTPKTDKEWSFLQTQAKSRSTYGWSLNLEKSYYTEDKYFYSQPHNFKENSYRVDFEPDVNTIPPLQKSFDKINKCVALHVADRPRIYYRKRVEITTEPCDIQLWVVCESKVSSFPEVAIDYEKWFSNDDQLFWVSGKLANQADAGALCKKANMKLITNINSLMEALNVTFDYIPWWTDFKIGQSGPETEDGTGVDFSVVSWLEDDILKMDGSVVLLRNGNSRPVGYTYGDEVGLPYICKRRPNVEGLYGCPNLWFRAGRSCYYFSRHDPVPWSEAKATCESQDSHLLTINSLDEKLWVDAVALRYISDIWTSANDIAKEGEFTWHDGSKIDSNILRWQKAPFNNYYNIYTKGCMIYNVRDYVDPMYCKSGAKKACQYDLEEDETQCKDGWKKFEKTCYRLFFEEDYKSYAENELYCRTSLSDKWARPLAIKTRAIATFLNKAYEDTAKNYASVWLGMKSDGALGDWRWYDGTLVDFTVFNIHNEPDNGGNGEPENCMIIKNDAVASDRPCGSIHYYICEKDLSPVSALGSEPDSAPPLRFPFLIIVPVFASIISFYVTNYL